MNHFDDNTFFRRICKHCGVEFEGYPSDKFCSEDCRVAFIKSSYFACAHCGKKTPKTPGVFSKYCSEECKLEAFNKKRGWENSFNKRKRKTELRNSIKMFECPYESGRLSEEITKNMFHGMMI